MDRQTASLLDALRHPGAAFLSRLLLGPATESQLMSEVARASQPTGNRRLAELERVGLAEREPGRWRAPGRRWDVVHPEETDALLNAAFELSDVVGDRQRRIREEARKRQRKARARRRGLRDVTDGRPDRSA